MMGVRKNSRQPLWKQRLKSAELLEQVVREDRHPLIRETRRECMQELWDAEGVRELLYEISAGTVKVLEIYTETPSPMSLPLQWAQEAAVMYDYAPTPRGIHTAVEEMLKEAVKPGTKELSQLEESHLLRKKLPKDARQLHSLLMTEGDLAAGELEVPVEWLDSLAQSGRVCYLEQGLWIAAEEQEKYAAALGGEILDDGAADCDTKRFEAQLLIARRMLRYRGAADVVQTAVRYGWQLSLAEKILEELCSREEAVRQDGKYYHAELYRRACIQTLKNRRNEAQTCPAQAYAALLLSRMESSAPAEEALPGIIKYYAGMTLPASYWEEILLPRWVKQYKESVLDAYLAEGEVFWYLQGKGGLRFELLEQIDWDAAPDCLYNAMECALSEKEQILYHILQKRGASFMQSFNNVFGSESPYDTLMSLMEKGLVCADSFVPVRQWLSQEHMKKVTAKQRVSIHVKALRAGRWDIVHPLKQVTDAQSDAQSLKTVLITALEQCFDRYVIVCRETAAACGLSWQEALSVLRVWEYTGQARRGYFVEGLSGAQFIRGKEYEAVVHQLARNTQNGQKIVWVNAADPVQCWGKLLPHMEGRNFLNVPGTAVACCGGIPAAVFERQGAALRVFEEELAEACLTDFSLCYKQGKLFPTRKRIVVKNYPDFAGEALTRAGFFREMQDYVLYR